VFFNGECAFCQRCGGIDEGGALLDGKGWVAVLEPGGSLTRMDSYWLNLEKWIEHVRGAWLRRKKMEEKAQRMEAVR
jgi:hypothetical protein